MTEILSLTSAPPRLVVVHSAQAMPRFFGFAGAEALVYDQNLGQILSQLTRITVRGLQPKLVDAYLAKVLALRLLLHGKFNEAAVLATVYAMNHEELRSARQTSFERSSEMDGLAQPALHHVLTGAQERFVLAHELAHYVARVEPAAFAMLVGDMLDVLRGWVRARSDLVVDPAVFDDQYMTSIEEAWERRHGPLDEEFKRAQREQYRQSSMAPTPGQRASQVLEEIESNETLQVEVACDTVAMLVVMFSAQPQTLTSDVAGSALALHHLRLLQLIDDCAEDNPSGASASLNIQESMTRLTAFRACVSGFASVAFGEDSGVAELLHEQITEVNLTHSTVVGDQYLFHAQQKFRDLLDALRQESAKDSAETTGIGDISVTRKILGLDT